MDADRIVADSSAKFYSDIAAKYGPDKNADFYTAAAAPYSAGPGINVGGAPAPPPSYNPAADTEMTGMQRLGAGFGKGFVDTARSARQLAMAGLAQKMMEYGMQIPPWLSDRINAESKESGISRERDKPLMNTPGGFGGNALSYLAQSAVAPIGAAETGLGRIALASGVGAAQGALTPTAEGESSAPMALIGGATGGLFQGLANVVGSVVRGASAGNPGLQKAADWIRSQGGNLSFGQLTGNELAQRTEAFMSKLPGASYWYKNLNANQQDVVQKVFDGLSMGRGGGQALAEAGADKVFRSDDPFIATLRSLPERTTLAPGQPTAALNVAAKYAGESAPHGFGGSMRIASPSDLPQSILDRNPQLAGMGPKTPASLPSGTEIPMVGPQGDFNNYQAIRSQLRARAFEAGKGTPEAETYKAIRGAFDDAAMRSMEAQGADPTVLAKARNAIQVEKLLEPAEIQGANPGEITYNWTKATKEIDDAFREGTVKNLPQETQDQLRQAMNFMRTVKLPSTSGTAENQMAKGLATLGILGGLGEAGFGDEAHHIPLMVAGLAAAPWLVNQGLQTATRGIPFIANKTPEWVSLLAQQGMATLPAATLGGLASQ